MANKRHKPEEIVSKLRQVEHSVLASGTAHSSPSPRKRMNESRSRN